jgi:hypothetical protein
MTPGTNGHATPSPTSPAPGTINVGQALKEGRIWAAIFVTTPAANLQASEGMVQVSMAVAPEDLTGLISALSDLRDAGQVALQRKPGLILPGQ